MAEILTDEDDRKHVCEILHNAFIEIRMLCWDGRHQQAADLADAVHNIPMEIYGWGGGWNFDLTRSMLKSYVDKYGGTGAFARDYALQLDHLPSRRRTT